MRSKPCYLRVLYRCTWSCVKSMNALKQVLSRSGKIEELTDSHRPYGSSKAAVQEMKRIKEAGGWVCLPNSFMFKTSQLSLKLACV